jgi:hypothetical protein
LDYENKFGQITRILLIERYLDAQKENNLATQHSKWFKK